MRAIEAQAIGADHALHRLAAGLALCLGVFLLLGALGHLSAVWPDLAGLVEASVGQALGLLGPGLILLLSGLINGFSSAWLWQARARAVILCLIVNGGLALYLVALLTQGVPGHPIGFFLALVGSQLVVLAAIQLGLRLPSSN